ncbi:MAG: copper chaperone PCu(A)C [Pseudomonadota bacterium]
MACSPQEQTDAPTEEAIEFTVTDAEVALSPVPGRPAAAYFTLNGGASERSLTSVDIVGADNVMLHETVENDGVASMQEIEAITIPAGEKVTFERGGKHVMIFGLDAPAEGETVAMTLNFADGETLAVEATASTIGSDSE